MNLILMLTKSNQKGIVVNAVASEKIKHTLFFTALIAFRV